MSEPPQFVRRPSIARVRPGANGVLMQTLGTWAEQFEVTTKAAAWSHLEAYELYYAYNQLVGADSVDVIYDSIPLAIFGHVFFVTSVTPVGGSPRTGIRRIVRGVGPEGQYFAECSARWRLQPVVDLPP